MDSQIHYEVSQYTFIMQYKYKKYNFYLRRGGIFHRIANNDNINQGNEIEMQKQ